MSAVAASWNYNSVFCTQDRKPVSTLGSSKLTIGNADGTASFTTQNSGGTISQASSLRECQSSWLTPDLPTLFAATHEALTVARQSTSIDDSLSADTSHQGAFTSTSLDDTKLERLEGATAHSLGSELTISKAKVETRTYGNGVKQSQGSERKGRFVTSLESDPQTRDDEQFHLEATIGGTAFCVQLVVGHEAGISPLPSWWILKREESGVYIFGLDFNSGASNELLRLRVSPGSTEEDGRRTLLGEWQVLDHDLCEKGQARYGPEAILES